MDTVVVENANPIEAAEHSMLLLASTVHQRAPSQLVRDEQLQRVSAHSPALFLAA